LEEHAYTAPIAPPHLQSHLSGSYQFHIRLVTFQLSLVRCRRSPPQARHLIDCREKIDLALDTIDLTHSKLVKETYVVARVLGFEHRQEFALPRAIRITMLFGLKHRQHVCDPITGLSGVLSLTITIVNHVAQH
jgi:hypothetical protein